MTVLDNELLHSDIHFTARIVAAVAVCGAVVTLLGISLLAPPATTPAPAPTADYYGCPPGKADCELQWMLENLTQIESPILILEPGDI